MLIDREFYQLLREKMDPLLKELGGQLGVTFSFGTGTYEPNGSSGSLKLIFAANKPDGTAVTKEAADFTKYARAYGLEPTDLGKKFSDGRSTFTIIGLRTRAKVNAIITKNQNGKANVWPAGRVLYHLGRPARPPLFGSSQPMTEDDEGPDEDRIHVADGRAEAAGS